MALLKNRALVLHPNLKLKVEEIPIPEPKADDVIIAIHSTGICGTDLHMWSHGGAGEVKVTKPLILGHESSGTVVKIGSLVRNLKVGDRVTVEPAIPCLSCKACIGGRYNLCPSLDGRGYPNDGMCCNYYAHPAIFCFKLPDSVTLEEGALVEPLAVSVHVCRRAGITGGQTILIIGAGPIGLLSLLVAKALGATTAIIADLSASRLALAKKLGADHVITVSKNTSIKNEVLSAIGELPDVSIDCCGSGSTVESVVEATRPGGVVTIVGLGGDTAKVFLPNLVMNELDIRGVSRYMNCYPTALSLLGSGAVDVRPLITHRFVLAEAEKAFQTASSTTSDAVKVIIQTEDLLDVKSSAQHTSAVKSQIPTSIPVVSTKPPAQTQPKAQELPQADAKAPLQELSQDQSKLPLQTVIKAPQKDFLDDVTLDQPKSLLKEFPKTPSKELPKSQSKALEKDLAEAQDLLKSLSKEISKDSTQGQAKDLPKVELPKVQIPDVTKTQPQILSRGQPVKSQVSDLSKDQPKAKLESQPKVAVSAKSPIQDPTKDPQGNLTQILHQSLSDILQQDPVKSASGAPEVVVKELAKPLSKEPPQASPFVVPQVVVENVSKTENQPRAIFRGPRK